MVRRLVSCALLALACSGTPVEPLVEPEPEAAPVLRFVGICDRPTIWWLRREPAIDAPAMWLFMQTDSVEYPADTAFTGLRWREIDGAASIIADGEITVDSLGAGRAIAECVPISP